jgi:hypothetical protein
LRKRAYQSVATLKKPAIDPKLRLFWGRLLGDSRLLEALRVGDGKLRWPQANS